MRRVVRVARMLAMRNVHKMFVENP